MSDYLKCTLTNIRTNVDWPAPPTEIWLPYYSSSIEDVGGVQYGAEHRTFECGRVTASGITRLKLIAYWTSAKFVHWDYGELVMNNTDYFSPAVVGVHTGFFDTIWTIERYESYGTLNLPIGYDAEPGTSWINDPVETQLGGVPVSAITPAPADNETGVQLVLPKLTWETQ